MDSSSDAIIGKTLDGVVLSWNRFAERIFGYRADEMVGRSVFALIPEELHDAERDMLERLRRGEGVEKAEVERVRKDGHRIWVTGSIAPLRDPLGNIVGAASIKRDVTDEKLAADRHRETQRLRVAGQLAGGIAHDANNQMLDGVGGLASSSATDRGPAGRGAAGPRGRRRPPADRSDHAAAPRLRRRRRGLRPTCDVRTGDPGAGPMLRRSLLEAHELKLGSS